MVKVGLLLTAKPEYGGSYQYTLSVLESCKHLKNYQFTIYTTPDNDYYKSEKIPIKRIFAERKNWFHLITANFLNISIADSFQDEDVIFAATYTPILLHTKTKFIFTLHDLQEHYLPDNFSLVTRIWRKYIYTALCKKSSLIHCESEYVKNDISKILKVSKEKIYVLPAPAINLNDSNLSKEQIHETVKKYNLPEVYLFYPAHFWLHKNHDKLIDAFEIITKKFDHTYLILTGKKLHEYAHITAKIKKLGLENRVIHLGYLSQEDLWVVYKKSTIVVIPTLFESISIPIYEAFQIGVPVCASNVVSLPEQVGDAAMLFDPLDVADMAKSITSLLENPELRKELVRRGSNKMKEVNIESFAHGLDIMLKKALSI